jgi:transcriptional regulator with XRE-family HTH domain
MENSGMTQADVATLLGIKQPAMSLLLSGKRRITADHARKLAQRFKLGLDYFLSHRLGIGRASRLARRACIRLINK